MRRLNLMVALAGAVASFAVLPAPAGAGVASISRSVVGHEAAAGEVNRVRISLTGASGETSTAVIEDVNPITPGAGCVAVTTTRVRCSLSADFGLGVRTDLGDRNDRLTVIDNQDFPGDLRVLDGPGDDRIDAGRAGPTSFVNGPGNDHFLGSLAPNLSTLGYGNDVLVGGIASDHLRGGLGRDRIFGGEGNDLLEGGRGNDRLFGGRGRDRLYGGSGFDVLDGRMTDFRIG